MQVSQTISAPSRDYSKSSDFDRENVLKDLNQKLDDHLVNHSLGSSEGIEEIHSALKPEANPVNAKTINGNTELYYKMIRDTIPEFGLTLASITHCISGLDRLTKFLPKSLSNFIDTHAQKLSKAVNILNYIVTAGDAFWHKRSVDGLARSAYPIVIPSVSLEDMYTASGFSSGTTMVELAMRDKTEKMPNNDGFGANIINNLKAYKITWQELTSDGITAFFSKLLNVRKDYKPLTFVGGNFNFMGALLGLTFGQISGSMRKLATLVRDIGSITTDLGKMFCGESNFAVSGAAYIVVALLDVAKDYAPGELKRTLSHFGVAISNFANYYYLRASKVRSEAVA